MLGYIKTRPRLLVAAAIGAVLWVCLPDEMQSTTRFLSAWNISIGFYLALMAVMMLRSNTQLIKQRAADTDEGAFVILTLTILTCVASIGGIIGELSSAKDLAGFAKGMHIALAGFTVILSWTFLHTMFALHYAHEFYDEEKGILGLGLQFPEDSHEQHYEPDYWDFIYYSFVIGTAAATADINITSPEMRRTTTVHCVVSFFFNTTILALMINISASLL